MGEVYRAIDTRLDRQVALKALPAHLASDPDFVLRFEREGRAIAALNHPHICTLFDIGRQAGLTFLVLELLEAGLTDARTDVLAFGSVLYEMLTGSRAAE
jgi:serine/threonine protein kinase